jgi:SagB-type dehydrogenase family enzyme
MIRRLAPGDTADGSGHRVLPTITIEETIVGVAPTHDDPTETYHEASRLYPDISDPCVRGIELIETSDEMRASTTRSTKRHPTATLIRLPKPDLGGISLAEALTRRRSRRSDASKRLGLPQLATLLGAAYGVTARLDAYGQTFRTAPSAGALYPLELYVATRLVDGVDQALFHYDPLRHALERLRPLDPGHELEPLAPYPELVRECAAVIVMTAMLWRSRFKYGARAYRFALMEAGHVGQNLMLAATALDLAVVPLGGFYDVRVDSLVDVDGVNEATIYLFAVATP